MDDLKNKRDGSKENDSERSHLQHLEGFFAQLSKRPDCSNFSSKVSEFVDLMSSNSLNNIIGASLGLYGEINTLEKVWALQAVSRYSSLVEIPLDSDSRNDKKIVDVRLFFSETNTYQYFESKCKKPGLGFDGEESKLNDYLMHVVPLILDYINICVRSINIDQLFPRISRRKPTPFGALSDFVKSMSEKGFRVRYSENELSKIDVEKEVIKNFLDCFFDEECIEQESYPLPSPQGILNHYKRSAEPLFRKNFFKNTIKASLKKFQGEGKRARESNSSVASYVICWTFFHSGSLIDDPFLTENGRKKLVKHSEDEIRKIFNEVVLLPEFLDLKNQKTELLFL